MKVEEGRLGVLAGVLLAAAHAIGLALSPYLLVEHPLVLLALAPEVALILMVGANAGLATMLLVAVPRRALGLWASFIIGQTYGAAALDWAVQKLPRMAPFLRRVEGLVRRTGAPALLIAPTSGVALVVGSAGAPGGRSAVAGLVGSSVLLVGLHYSGAALSEWVDVLIALLAAHLAAATGVSVALVLAYELIRRRRASGSSTAVVSEGERGEGEGDEGERGEGD